jgi:inner membrane transporter RhtA
VPAAARFLPASRAAERVPAPALVLAAAVSVQSGAAIAVRIFPQAGPVGAVWLRLAFSAVLMLAVARPALRSTPRPALLVAVAFGVVLAAMNTAFYLAIDRVPLGVAVTVEFIGPLAVAVGGSRRRLDLLWVLLAAAGVVLLAGADHGSGQAAHVVHPGAHGHLDPLGLGLAAIAGGCWSGYILLSKRVGQRFPGASGLTIALVVGGLGLAPAALILHPSGLADPGVLGAGLGVAVLSSAIPYTLELSALRRLRAATFGVLLSLDPAVAALSGWAVLGQQLHWSEWLAIGCVSAASAAASLAGRDRDTTVSQPAEPPELAAVGAREAPLPHTGGTDR